MMTYEDVKERYNLGDLSDYPIEAFKLGYMISIIMGMILISADMENCKVDADVIEETKEDIAKIKDNLLNKFVGIDRELASMLLDEITKEGNRALVNVWVEIEEMGLTEQLKAEVSELLNL